ncbi:MAG: hypothetical protein KH135_04765 [Firmicutes bacterium]|nr:hypothetical protein [Bacillota bacterium]
MKVIDYYQEYKEKYPEYIIFIKVGKFYEVYFEDTKLIHILTGYKISKTQNGVEQVGFPTTSLSKVIKEISKRKINYILIEKDEVYKIVEKKRFQRNQYSDIKQQFYDVYQLQKRIYHIQETLLQHIHDHNIHEVLTQIENLYG